MSKKPSKKRRNHYVEVKWSKEDAVWHVHFEEQFAIEWYSTKVAAVKEGRRYAKRFKRELVVKNKNGRIGYRNSYGNDPRSRKG